jgi:hypothetical protein
VEQVPTGSPKLVVPVEVQISTEQEPQEFQVKDTQEVWVVPRVDGLVVVVVVLQT